jgi:peptidoglycan-associated lipoprotein
VAPPPTATAPVATVAPPPPAQPTPTVEAKVQPAAIPPHLDPKNDLATKRSVWFDYDIYAIKPEFNQLLQLHGKYLASNPKLSIRVEGNADERGGAEYNLALGQKRADAVVQALKVFGVAASQVEAVSWGKEKPKNLGHDEAAWAANRRVDLVYPAK